MTAASPLPRRQPSHPVSARAVRAEPVARIASPMLLPAAAAEDEFRMNLGDLPRMSPGLHVDGFAPSLTSRILDLLDRIRGR